MTIATKSPAGSFHRKRSPFLPEEGWFGVTQDRALCAGCRHALDTHGKCPTVLRGRGHMLHRNDSEETRSSMWLRRRVGFFAESAPLEQARAALVVASMPVPGRQGRAS